MVERDDLRCLLLLTQKRIFDSFQRGVRRGRRRPKTTLFLLVESVGLNERDRLIPVDHDHLRLAVARNAIVDELASAHWAVLIERVGNFGGANPTDLLSTKEVGYGREPASNARR